MTDPRSLPQRWVEEHVESPLRFWANRSGFRVGDVFREPLFEFFMIPPVAIGAGEGLKSEQSQVIGDGMVRRTYSS